MNKIIICILIGIALGALPVLGTPITSCTTITSSGSYELQNDILNNPSTICIHITASSVILDGKGHTIDGIDISSEPFRLQAFLDSIMIL